MLKKADRYFFDITTRKFFCIWIEKYIEAIKTKSQLKRDASLKSVLSRSKSRHDEIVDQQIILRDFSKHSLPISTDLDAPVDISPNSHHHISF